MPLPKVYGHDNHHRTASRRTLSETASPVHSALTRPFQLSSHIIDYNIRQTNTTPSCKLHATTAQTNLCIAVYVPHSSFLKTKTSAKPSALK